MIIRTKQGKEIESIQHNKIKRIAREFLLLMGFRNEEIYEEVIWNFWYGEEPNEHTPEGFIKTCKHRFIIDICGLKENFKVGIECGECGKDKLRLLSSHPTAIFRFDKIYHFISEKTIKIIK